MQGLGIALATLAIIFSVLFLVGSQVEDQINDIDGNPAEEDYSTAQNATRTLMSAADDVPGWFPLIVIAVIGAILLGLVKMYR